MPRFRARALNPEHPKTRGSHENGDIFFQHREACNEAYNALPAVVKKYMDKINAKIGTNYDLFNYYGAEDADPASSLPWAPSATWPRRSSTT